MACKGAKIRRGAGGAKGPSANVTTSPPCDQLMGPPRSRLKLLLGSPRGKPALAPFTRGPPTLGARPEGL